MFFQLGHHFLSSFVFHERILSSAFAARYRIFSSINGGFHNSAGDRQLGQRRTASIAP